MILFLVLIIWTNLCRRKRIGENNKNVSDKIEELEDSDSEEEEDDDDDEVPGLI